MAVKALGTGTLDEAVQPSNVTQEAENAAFATAGAITPRFPPADLFATYERSSLLQPNVAAYATNIETFGHRFEPTIDLKAPDARDKVRDALILERLYDGGSAAVTDEEVSAAVQEIEAVQRIERLQLEAFFERCCPTMSFTELREQKRYHEEIAGNAYWEVVRDHLGFVAELNLVPPKTVRATEMEPRWHEVQLLQRISATALRRVTVRRRFRRYVQVICGIETTWFKELDDDRIMSSKTGRYYASTDALEQAEGGVAPATEILHFRVGPLSGAYGVPRWVGALPVIRGCRDSEEVNAKFFRDDAVPDGAIFVSGGTLGEGADQVLRDHFRNRFARKSGDTRKPFEVVVLEATPHESPMGTPGETKVSFQRWREQQEDALFQQYEKNCAEKVGSAFRLPRLLRGDASDFNRATSESSLEYAEQQVFQPERQKFDDIMTTRILVALFGSRFWCFRSNGIVIRDVKQVSEVLKDLVEANVLLPSEARPVAADALGVQLEPIEAPWVKKPYAELTKPRSTGETVTDLMEMRTALDAKPPPGSVAAAIDAGTEEDATDVEEEPELAPGAEPTT